MIHAIGQRKIRLTTVFIGLIFFAPSPDSSFLNGLSSSHQTKLFRSSSAFPSDQLSNKKTMCPKGFLFVILACVKPAASRVSFIAEILGKVQFWPYFDFYQTQQFV